MPLQNSANALNLASDTARCRNRNQALLSCMPSPEGLLVLEPWPESIARSESAYLQRPRSHRFDEEQISDRSAVRKQAPRARIITCACKHRQALCILEPRLLQLCVVARTLDQSCSPSRIRLLLEISSRRLCVSYVPLVIFGMHRGLRAVPTLPALLLRWARRGGARLIFPRLPQSLDRRRPLCSRPPSSTDGRPAGATPRDRAGRAACSRGLLLPLAQKPWMHASLQWPEDHARHTSAPIEPTNHPPRRASGCCPGSPVCSSATATCGRCRKCSPPRVVDAMAALAACATLRQHLVGSCPTRDSQAWVLKRPCPPTLPSWMLLGPCPLTRRWSG